MRTLGEVRLPSLGSTELAAPKTKHDLERSMKYTWTSVLYEIPNVARKHVGKVTKYSKDSDGKTVYQPRAPRTPKTPRTSRTSADQKSAKNQRVKPKTPVNKIKDVKCRHKNNIQCQRCKPVPDKSYFKRRTPRATPLQPVQYTPRNGDGTQINSQLRLPPIERAYSIAALRKHKEAATDFLFELRRTFPRTPVSRTGSVTSLAYGPTSGGPLRRSRSVNSVSDHVSRLYNTRSVQNIYGLRGPNIPIHFARSHSVSSLQTSANRSRSQSKGNIVSRSGRRSRSLLRSTHPLHSVGNRSQSTSVTRMYNGRPSASRAPSIRQTRGDSREQCRDSVRSKPVQKVIIPRARSVSKSRSKPSNRNRAQSRDLPVVVRLTKTPSAPDIYRTSSRMSVNSNDGRRKKFPLFMAIKPENQITEKEKFFRSNFQYSPIFSYPAPPTDSQLQKYSRASDRLIHLAVAIMNNAIKRFGTYEKYMELTGGRKLSRFEIIQAAKNYLKDENMEDEVDINISEDLLSRARMAMVAGRPTVIVRATNMREHWVDGMLKHEIGTHYVRAWNNKLQVWGNSKKRKEHHLEPANPTEEGLASLHSIIFRKDPCLWRCAMLYYTIYQATQMSFADVFRDLGRFVKDPEVRWEYCIRAKRGQIDTGIPGAFCKDQVYLNGALQLLKHIHDIDFHVLVKCGKVSYRDLPKLEAIGPDLDRTRIPSFMVDQEIYKRELERIMIRNGLTKEHLDILP